MSDYIPSGSKRPKPFDPNAMADRVSSGDIGVAFGVKKPAALSPHSVAAPFRRSDAAFKPSSPAVNSSSASSFGVAAPVSQPSPSVNSTDGSQVAVTPSWGGYVRGLMPSPSDFSKGSWDKMPAAASFAPTAPVSQKSKLHSAIDGAINNPAFRYQATRSGYVDVNGNNLRDQIGSGIKKRLQAMRAGQPDAPNETGLTQAIRSEIATGQYKTDDNGNYIHKLSGEPIDKILVGQFDGYLKSKNPPRTQSYVPSARPQTSVAGGMSPEGNVAAAIQSEINAGNASYNPAFGGVVVDNQTGQSMGHKMADAMGRSRADQMADAAGSQARWDAGFGVGDQMNRKRQAEMDGVQSSWDSYYARKKAEEQAAGVSPQEYRETKRIADAARFEQMKNMAALDVAQKQAMQAQRDLLNPRNAQYRQELADSRARNDAAKARRRRFEYGLPADEQEAMLFAMQRGTMADPNKAMESFGGGMQSLGQNNADLAKAGLVSGVEMARVQNDALDKRSARSLDERKFAQETEDRLMEQGIQLAGLSEDEAYMSAVEIARQNGKDDVQANIEGMRARERARARINELSRNPLFYERGLRPYGDAPSQGVAAPSQGGATQPMTPGELRALGSGSAQQPVAPTVNGMTPNEAMLRSIGGGATQSPVVSPAQPPALSAFSRPNTGISGYGRDGVSGELDLPSAMDFHSKAKAKYGSSLTPALLADEMRAAGVSVSEDVKRQMMNNASATAQQGIIPWTIERLMGGMLPATAVAAGAGVDGSVGLGGRAASAKASPYADAVSAYTGKQVKPYDRTWMQYFGF